jgi:hypothetical protein
MQGTVLAGNLVAYAAMLGYAIWSGWRSEQLVWAFWLCGVVMTMATALLQPILQVPSRLAAERRAGGGESPWSMVGDALFVTLFLVPVVGVVLVTLVFGSFGEILNSFIPLIPARELGRRGNGLFNVWVLSAEALRYWPLVAAVCAVRFFPILRAIGTPRFDEAFNNAFFIEFSRALVVAILAFVVHVGIGAWSRTGATIANFVLLALLLFPWMALVRTLSGASRRGASRTRA